MKLAQGIGRRDDGGDDEGDDDEDARETDQVMGA